MRLRCNVQKKGRMKRLVAKLRDRVASLQLEVEQLQIDKEALKYAAVAHFDVSSRIAVFIVNFIMPPPLG